MGTRARTTLADVLHPGIATQKGPFLDRLARFEIKGAVPTLISNVVHAEINLFTEPLERALFPDQRLPWVFEHKHALPTVYLGHDVFDQPPDEGTLAIPIPLKIMK
eukprot:9472967-Pyramimonas_sp.AAC.1